MEQFDVLVVGSGGAGQRAALEVGRRKGLKVALITKIFPTRSALVSKLLKKRMAWPHT